MAIDRNKVLEKYNGHCGYCGNEITLSTMQIDHIIPKHIMGTNAAENLMPSCRLCNHYKRAETLERFRQLLITMKERLEKVYIFRVAIKYRMIEWHGFDGLFYFEQQEGKNGKQS
jgi:hypothetical protein